MLRLPAIIVILGLSSLAMAQKSELDSLLEQSHFKQARVLAEKRLAANPKDPAALVALGRVKIAYKDYDGGAKLAEQALTADPKYAMAHATLLEAYGSKIEGPDVGTFEKMRLAKSIKREGEATLALDPKNVFALGGMRQFHLEAPGMVGGDKKQAPVYLERLRAVDPVKAYLQEADEALKTKNYKGAETIYRKALEVNPKSADVMVRLSSLYSVPEMKDLDKSESYAKQAIQAQPSSAVGYSVLAQVLASREKWADLDQLMPQAEKAVPDDFSYYYQAARVLLNTGKDNPRAERYLRKYLTQEPEGTRPPLGAAHWRLGLLLEREGNKNAAVQEVQTAVRLNPELKDAQKDLKRISK